METTDEHTFALTPQERHHRKRSEAIDPEYRAPLIEPGSVEEERALAAIAERRADERERLGDTAEARERRARTWWGRHYRHGAWND